jgi:hypothetical protein
MDGQLEVIDLIAAKVIFLRSVETGSRFESASKTGVLATVIMAPGSPCNVGTCNQGCRSLAQRNCERLRSP